MCHLSDSKDESDPSNTTDNLVIEQPSTSAMWSTVNKNREQTLYRVE